MTPFVNNCHSPIWPMPTGVIHESLWFEPMPLPSPSRFAMAASASTWAGCWAGALAHGLRWTGSADRAAHVAGERAHLHVAAGQPLLAYQWYVRAAQFADHGALRHTMRRFAYDLAMRAGADSDHYDADALQWYQRAVAVAPEPVLRAEAWAAVADCHHALCKTDQAMGHTHRWRRAAACVESGRAWLAGHCPEEAANAFHRAGKIYLDHGDLPHAELYCLTAVRLWQSIGDEQAALQGLYRIHGEDALRRDLIVALAAKAVSREQPLLPATAVDRLRTAFDAAECVEAVAAIRTPLKTELCALAAAYADRVHDELGQPLIAATVWFLIAHYADAPEAQRTVWRRCAEMLLCAAAVDVTHAKAKSYIRGAVLAFRQSDDPMAATRQLYDLYLAQMADGRAVGVDGDLGTLAAARFDVAAYVAKALARQMLLSHPGDRDPKDMVREARIEAALARLTAGAYVAGVATLEGIADCAALIRGVEILIAQGERLDIALPYAWAVRLADGMWHRHLAPRDNGAIDEALRAYGLLMDFLERQGAYSAAGYVYEHGQSMIRRYAWTDIGEAAFAAASGALRSHGEVGGEAASPREAFLGFIENGATPDLARYFRYWPDALPFPPC